MSNIVSNEWDQFLWVTIQVAPNIKFKQWNVKSTNLGDNNTES